MKARRSPVRLYKLGRQASLPYYVRFGRRWTTDERPATIPDGTRLPYYAIDNSSTRPWLKKGFGFRKRVLPPSERPLRCRPSRIITRRSNEDEKRENDLIRCHQRLYIMYADSG